MGSGETAALLIAASIILAISLQGDGPFSCEAMSYFFLPVALRLAAQRAFIRAESFFLMAGLIGLRVEDFFATGAAFFGVDATFCC